MSIGGNVVARIWDGVEVEGGGGDSTDVDEEATPLIPSVALWGLWFVVIVLSAEEKPNRSCSFCRWVMD